jgi:hypothetical protein
MWLLSQYSSQQCDIYTYILAFVETSSTSITNIDIVYCVHNLVHYCFYSNYLPLAHNINTYDVVILVRQIHKVEKELVQGTT